MLFQVSSLESEIKEVNMITDTGVIVSNRRQVLDLCVEVSLLVKNINNKGSNIYINKIIMIVKNIVLNNNDAAKNNNQKVIVIFKNIYT